MKFDKAKSIPGAGPSSAIGIMRFFDQDTGGPKMTPEFVVGFSVVFVVLVLVVKTLMGI